MGSSADRRSIAMGRPGDTEKLLSAVAKARINADEGFFIVGPELCDISSSVVRKALAEGNTDTLGSYLHPGVAQWCLSSSPYTSKHSGASGTAAAERSSTTDAAQATSAREKVSEIFKTWDADNDGVISCHELTLVLQQIGAEWTSDLCNKLFSTIDADQDSFISLDEFLCWAFSEDKEITRLRSALGLPSPDGSSAH